MVTGEFVGSDIVSVPSGSGPVSWGFPYAGPWEVVQVGVTDTLGNHATYKTDGTMQPGFGFGTLPHDVDLSGLSMELAPGEQDVRVVARPGRLTLVRSGLTADGQVNSGYRVTVQPAGVVRDVGPEAMATGTFDLTGLPNGVTQSVTFTARSAWGDGPTKTLSGRPVLSGNVTGIADVTGDRKPDVMAQRQYGLGLDNTVWSYPSKATGRPLESPTVFLPGWQNGCEQLGPMDVYVLGTGEPLCQHDDLVAINRGGGGQTIGTRGWRAMSWVDGGYSLNADAYPDIVAMNPQGELWLYPMSSRGTVVSPVRIGTGWGSMISVISRVTSPGTAAMTSPRSTPAVGCGCIRVTGPAG